MSKLFSPCRLGAIETPHRVLMAPLTRCRAGAGNVPDESTFYAPGPKGYVDYPAAG